MASQRGGGLFSCTQKAHTIFISGCLFVLDARLILRPYELPGPLEDDKEICNRDDMTQICSTLSLTPRKLL